jgi:arginine decarboxylase
MSEAELFFIKRWGAGYFDTNEKGNIVVKPNRQNAGGDLYELIQSVIAQGIEAPILVRFNGIIRDRIQHLNTAFQAAIKKYHYRGAYQMVYPIKANPQRHVVDIIQQSGQEFGLGLEVGSKPELIAVLSMECQPNMLMLCNGYKDREYILLALMAVQLGMRVIITIEQPYELNLVLKTAAELGVEAEIGIRMKLSAKGTGKWESSGGEHSKFGLFCHEIVACLERLKAEGKSHWLKLVHFHLGSQITTIKSIKKAMVEAACMYTEIATAHPSLTFFDVGGGVAVDYDGTKSRSDSSMNYTLEEYARDVVSHIGEACLAAGIPDPTIITESGRATVAHHSVLVTEVIDVTSPMLITESALGPCSDHEILTALSSLKKDLSLKNCRESFHDVMDLKERILEEFVHGKLTLNERACAELLCRSLFVDIRNLYRQLPEGGEEIDTLDKILLATYFCNFSVFQSLPDSWAIGQLFPVAPIHRLNEKPTHDAILSDLSCDSDGKISTFIGKKRPAHVLKLHEYTGVPYYIGIFLVGAYQEILGGLHNLFGDTNVVHAELDEKGGWALSRLVEGDTIEEVLVHVQYNIEKQKDQLNALVEQSIRKGRISLAESAHIKKKFKEALESYTYLVV